MSKVVIFGIDGGSLKLIEQWQDKLPNLRRIMENGVYGELESTIPPVTCPAWISMFTGKNPGKLGMYGFTTIRPDQQYDLGIHNSSRYHSVSLWKILNDHGKDVGLLNVPMTFPPHKIRSFMVCGIGAPEARTSTYTYPPELQKALDDVTGNYEIWTPLSAPSEGKEERYIRAVEGVLNKRLKAATYLINNFDWDLFVCVFWAADQIQHFFWHHMDETHPLHQGGEYQGIIKDFYQRIDSALGELIEKIPRDANILVVSDHGFGATHGSFLVNEWLECNGLLKFRGNVHPNRLSAALYRIRNLLLSNISPGLAQFLLKLAPSLLIEKLAVLNEQKNQLREVYKAIDWSQTKAYGCGSEGMVSVNLKGREPEGIVEPGEEYKTVRDDIVGRLRSLVDPQTGSPLPIKVFKRDEIYHGQYVSQAPDVLFSINGYLQTISAEAGAPWLRLANAGYSGWSGWHAPQGVFMAHGPDVRDSGEKLAELKIHDITPTVLYMFGLPVPDDMDGRVLREIFQPDSEPARRPVAYELVGEKDRVKGKIRKLKDSGMI